MDARSTNYLEFQKFHKLLMDSAPGDYKPFYFPVKKLGKDPDPFAIAERTTEDNPKKYSWKEDHARLEYDEVIARLKMGGNVGIAARSYDELHIIDIDDFDYLNQLPGTGLVNISRRRTGRHHFAWMKPEDKMNIPTDFGEIRSCDQYVVCAGSFVPTTKKDITEDVKNSRITKEQLNKILEDNKMGLYTVHNNSDPPEWFLPNDLPEFFKKQLIKNKTAIKIKVKNKNVKFNEKHSALFDLNVSDIIETMPKRRVGHPLHSSDTNANWCISDDGVLGHCWRHLVSLNAIQFLCVKAGYKNCLAAGVGHKGISPSEIEGDIQAIWIAWCEAKKCGLIPINDPIPIKAIWWIAIKHKLVSDKVDINKMMNFNIYNKTLKIIEEVY